MIWSPCKQSYTGRPITEQMHTFTAHLKNNPSNYKYISETVSVSKLSSMSLEEYNYYIMFLPNTVKVGMLVLVLSDACH